MLDDRHFRAFSVAYEDGRPIEDVAMTLRSKRPAATETLRRALRNVNEILIAEVSSRTGLTGLRRPPGRRTVESKKKNSSPISPDAERILARVLEALEALIHEDPWSSGA